MSNQDVDNYKQIKADLDQLRLTVEKSELWVEKSSSYESGDLGESQTKGNDEPNEVCLGFYLGTVYCFSINHNGYRIFNHLECLPATF